MGVSVLTLMKGRGTHLAQLIEGLRRSEQAPQELVVVDMEGAWRAPRAGGFPIRVIGMKSDGLPLARARNAAAAAADADQLLFLDVDCIPRRGLVSAISTQLARTHALICAEIRYLSAPAVTARWEESSLEAFAEPHPVRSFPDHGLRLERNPGLFWSLAFGIERAQFTGLGGFDECFDGYGAEDTDFGFRAEAAGIPLFFLGGTGAFHQHHAVFDPPLQHFGDIVRNAITFHRKWQRWPMEGWLEGFAALGLIERAAQTITIVREPTAMEIAAARADRRF